MDFSHPLTPRRVRLWDDVPPPAGHVQAGHVMGLHLDSVIPDGHTEGTHLLDEHLRPAAPIVFETMAFVFGRFRHAVVMEDAAGNWTSAGVAIQETVINSEPVSADEFAPTGHDGQTGRLTFTFRSSYRLTG
jgi:hypothetical protein